MFEKRIAYVQEYKEGNINRKLNSVTKYSDRSDTVLNIFI